MKFDLSADASRKRKIDGVTHPLQLIAPHIDFSAHWNRFDN
ncbi:hypothetical protein LJR066_006682 [Acidovorax sp. LjRoot66]